MTPNLILAKVCLYVISIIGLVGILDIIREIIVDWQGDLVDDILPLVVSSIIVIIFCVAIVFTAIVK